MTVDKNGNINKYEFTVKFAGFNVKRRKPISITFKPGITAIIGHNSSGKTELVDELADIISQQNVIRYMYYDRKYVNSYKSGGVSSLEEFESLYWSCRCAKLFAGGRATKSSPLDVMIFDGIDNYSVDNLRKLMDLFKFQIKQFPNLCIIIATNNYEYTRGARCIIGHTGKEVKINSYEDFVKVNSLKRYRY